MTIWYGKQGSVSIGTSIGSVVGTTSLYSQVSGTDFSGECKDLTINPGDADVDALNVFGSQMIEESRPSLVTADFTMVFTDIDIWKFSMSTASTAPSGFERFQGADLTGGKTKRAIGFQLLSTTQGTLRALMNNAYVTSQGELSVAADGSAEQSFSAACLNTDFYAEDNF